MPNLSRVETILRNTIDGTEYTGTTMSRVEALLKELNELIIEGGGGGGGGGDTYTKAQIDAMFDEVYSKDDVDDLIETLEGIINDISSNVYTKSQTYSKAEIDNELSAIEQEIDWKEAVDYFTDLATTYPDAEEGWTASVLNSDVNHNEGTYRFNGTAWVEIYKLTPMATTTIDGLMSKEQVAQLNQVDADLDDLSLLIPASATVSNKLATDEDVDSVSDRVTTVEGLLDGHSVAKNVPADAKFTDTVYNDSAVLQRVGTVEQLLSGHSVAKNVPADAQFTDTVYDDTELAAEVLLNSNNIRLLSNELIRVEDESVDWESNSLIGAKNLLKYPYYNKTRTINGITWTDNGDGTVTADGTATSDSVFSCSVSSENFDNLYIKNGRYKISGINGGSSSTYSIRVGRSVSGSSEYYGYEYDGDFEFEANGDDFNNDKVRLIVTLVVKKNTTVSNLVFRPMLRIASDNDQTWQPYAQTNRELTLNKYDAKVNTIMGAKNLIPYPHQETTKTVNGLTFTDNGDGTITVNGTIDTGGVQYYLATRSLLSTRIPLNAGNYKLTGCPEGGSAETYSLYLNGYEAGTSTAITGMRDIGDGAIRGYLVNIVAGIYIDIRYDENNPLTFNNVIFKPMLRFESDSDDTYVPYAATNRQLTEDVEMHSNAIADIMNVYGAKNLIAFPPYYHGYSYTINGVTFTANEDGSVLVNGTNNSSSNAAYSLHPRNNDGTNFIPNGEYIINGSLAGMASNTYYVRVGITENGEFKSIGNETNNNGKITVNGDDYSDEGAYVSPTIVITPGATANNLLFKPMLRLASDTDDTWQPYAATNRELTVKKANTSMLGTDESGRTTASQAYAQGDYFVKDGKMYKAKVAIAQGASFTVGTNCEETTIFAELTALAQS